MGRRVVSLGQLSFDLDRPALTRAGGDDIPLGQKALALLGVLAEAGGAVVSKAELLDRVWPGLVIEEGNLTVQIASLRKALGVSPEGREWIVTVPRVGYRLAVATTADNLSTDARAPMPPRLAVANFRPVGEGAREKEFADAVTADLVTALARFRTFTVVAGETIENAAYALEGAVQRAGERLRIHTRLIERASGVHLWAERFDGAFEDIFDF